MLNHGFAAGSVQHRKASRPPGRSARAILRSAAAGSAKNITPKLDISRS